MQRYGRRTGKHLPLGEGFLMGSWVVRILGAIGAAALSVAMFGSGVASADLTGKTYDEAAAWISEHKGKAVVGAVSGDQLETGDCIVTSWHKSIYLDASGNNGRKNDYLLSLNCNNHVASPGNPGNSVMTPAGAAAKKDQQFVTNINKNPAWCEQDDAHVQRCETVCKRTGGCEVS
jgi:hypothetical protein